MIQQVTRYKNVCHVSKNKISCLHSHLHRRMPREKHKQKTVDTHTRACAERERKSKDEKKRAFLSAGHRWGNGRISRERDGVW